MARKKADRIEDRAEDRKSARKSARIERKAASGGAVVKAAEKKNGKDGKATAPVVQVRVIEEFKSDLETLMKHHGEASMSGMIRKLVAIEADRINRRLEKKAARAAA